MSSSLSSLAEEHSQVHPTCLHHDGTYSSITAIRYPVDSLQSGERVEKHGNMGNMFQESMSVFRNQVIRKGHDIQESVKRLSNNSKKDCIWCELWRNFIHILKMHNLCPVTWSLLPSSVPVGNCICNWTEFSLIITVRPPTHPPGQVSFQAFSTNVYQVSIQEYIRSQIEANGRQP